MEQREEWFGGSEGVFEFGGEGVGDAVPPEIDARMAAWISSVSPPPGGRYLGSGLSLPEPPRGRVGAGDDWRDRAVTSVLTESYARRMLDPNLERVEAVAISVMPCPPDATDEDEDDEPRRFFAPPSPRQRWERAVSEVSGRVSVSGSGSTSSGGIRTEASKPSSWTASRTTADHPARRRRTGG